MLPLAGTRISINDRLNDLGADGWELVKVDHQRWAHFRSRRQWTGSTG